MTGLAQIRGWRGETDTEEKLLRRLDSDLEYIATWSLPRSADHLPHHRDGAAHAQRLLDGSRSCHVRDPGKARRRKVPEPTLAGGSVHCRTVWPGRQPAARRGADPLPQRGSGDRQGRVRLPARPAGRDRLCLRQQLHRPHDAGGAGRRAQWCGGSGCRAKATSSGACSPISMPMSTSWSTATTPTTPRPRRACWHADRAASWTWSAPPATARRRDAYRPGPSAGQRCC